MAVAPSNSTQRPSQQLIYTLLGIYTGTCSVAQAAPAEGGAQLSPVLEGPVFPACRPPPCPVGSHGPCPGLLDPPDRGHSSPGGREPPASDRPALRPLATGVCVNVN